MKFATEHHRDELLRARTDGTWRKLIAGWVRETKDDPSAEVTFAARLSPYTTPEEKSFWAAEKRKLRD